MIPLDGRLKAVTLVVFASLRDVGTTRLARAAIRAEGRPHVPDQSCCFQVPGVIARRFT